MINRSKFKRLQMDFNRAMRILGRISAELDGALESLIRLEENFLPINEGFKVQTYTHLPKEEVRRPWGAELQTFRRKYHRSMPWISLKLDIPVRVLRDIENGRVPSKVMEKKLTKLIPEKKSA